MTKAHSEAGDNGGRCESCNGADTRYQRQSTVRVFLGGGLGLGTMWVCDRCRTRHDQRALLRVLLERVLTRRRYR